MEQTYLLKGSKAVMTMLLLAVSMSLAGNFGEAVLVNEEPAQPPQPNAYFGGSNASLFHNGQFYTVYVDYSRWFWSEQFIFASSPIGDGGLNFARTAFDENVAPDYRIYTKTVEPVMTLNSQGNYIVVYPKNENNEQTARLNNTLHRLIIDDEGNIIAGDSLYSNVYFQSQLLADNSKINLLFKEGTDGISICRFHQYSDIFRTLDDVPGNIRYFAGDIIYGRVHSNTDIWIRANSWPTFHGLVTTAGRVRVYPGGGTDYPEEQIFRGGLGENFPTMELPAYAQDVRKYGTKLFGGNERDDAIAHVTVEGTSYELRVGEIVVEDTEDPDFEWIEGNNQFTIYDNYPPYGPVGEVVGVNQIPKTDTLWGEPIEGTLAQSSIFVPMELWISGNFADKQTWASSHDIYLKDDLTYEGTQPGLRPDGFDNQGNQTLPINPSDYLGIISEESIYIQYGHFCPVDSVRKRPNVNDFYMYGSYFALGKGENAWEDGIITFQYQFPKGSTPPQYFMGEYYDNIDLHRFHYPTTVLDPWPLGLDYPWYNPLWPEPGDIYGFAGFPQTPNPHNAPEIVKLRGSIWLFGSMAQRRRGYVRRSGNPDFDTGLWDIENEIEPNTPPRYGAPPPGIGPAGYEKRYHSDHRLKHTTAPHLPKDNQMSPDGKKFHYWTSGDGNEFTPVFSGDLPDIHTCLKLAVHESSAAILVDRDLYLFPDNSTEYKKMEIAIPGESSVREMLFTEHGLFLLAAAYREDAYHSKLYHFSLQDNSLSILDEKYLPDLIQTVHLFNDHILWAAAVDAKTVEIHKYYHTGSVRASAVWEHNIKRPEKYCKELSRLALDSDSDMILATLNYHELLPSMFDDNLGGDIYTALGYFEFTAVEDDYAAPSTSSISLTNFPNPMRRKEMLSGNMMSINFSLPQAGFVEIDVFNIKGRHIRSLVSGEYHDGKHTVNWDGRDKNNNPVATGVYFYQMKANDKVTESKMLLVK